eukprot:Gregarina_sp_Poly_1__4549@NODE_2440_length_2134_cov_114_464925_g1550_i0_p1_GENE_NODE_2440_length_2134_cov_114_464925_g1550_i0NODE_2440_length_2134_cov_114_464925_g1550_i0_p1_ORF_typecomplete_len323_score34_79zfSNAP50_C/PF12251_8/3_5e03zfSNAP50_C/PF12251_8/5_1e09_NODE_2440_length_2134_cov_114_464925_g1550_i010462014
MRSTLGAFTTEQVSELLIKEPLQRIHFRFPAYLSSTKPQRCPLKLHFPRFDCTQKRPLILVRRPDDSPLSDFSIWRAQLYKSFSAVKRIGLHRQFVSDFQHALLEPGSVPIERTIRKEKRNRQENRKSSPLKFGAHDEYINVSFEYTYAKPLSKSVEQHPPIVVSARKDCPFHVLAVPLFSWPKSYIDDIRNLPLMKFFGKEGNVITSDQNVTRKVAVEEVLQLDIHYASFGSQLFQIKFLGTRHVPDSSNLYTVQPPPQAVRKCEACKIHGAELEVSESLVLPLSPTYLCKACYTELHPEPHDASYHGFVELLTQPDMTKT